MPKRGTTFHMEVPSLHFGEISLRLSIEVGLMTYLPPTYSMELSMNKAHKTCHRTCNQDINSKLYVTLT